MQVRITRRDFLAAGCAIALLPSAVGARRLISSGYRAVVRINLAGGNDAFNTVVPRSPAQYRLYQEWRGPLALRRADLLPLEGIGGSPYLALHSALAGVHALFLNGSIAVLAGMGALVEPYNGEAIASGRANLPDGLFAHRAQAAFWSGQRRATGFGCGDGELAGSLRESGLDARVLRLTVARRTDGSVKPPLVHALQRAVQIIASRRSNPYARDLIEVQYQGWDHHSDAIASHARALGSLNEGLLNLHANLLREGAKDEVIVYTSSEFGRALAPNGSGSDHGWSGHHFLMGGAVRGGVIYGQYPDLSPKGCLHVGRGVFAPTMPIDFVSAEIAGWIGLPVERVSLLYPYLGAFDSGGIASAARVRSSAS